jgi:hypothetical protein
MSKLHERFPTAESLLALTPEVLAPILLQIVADERQRGMFWPQNVLQVTVGSGMTAYFFRRRFCGLLREDLRAAAVLSTPKSSSFAPAFSFSRSQIG